MKLSTNLLLLSLLTTTCGAEAPRDSVQLQAVLDQLNVSVAPESLSPAPIPGFLEIVRGLEVLYVSADGAMLIDGDILSVTNEINLTERSRAAVRLKLIAGIPLDERIIVPAQNAKTEIIVFADTDCPYCTKLHEQSRQFAEQGIEIHYLLYPRSGPASESFAQAVSVWCSGNRLAALDSVLHGASLSAANCSNPVMTHYELARALDLRGTPAIVTTDGSVRYGVPSADEIIAAAGPIH